MSTPIDKTDVQIITLMSSASSTKRFTVSTLIEELLIPVT